MADSGRGVPEIQWDVEDRTDLLSDKEGHITGSTLYLTAALWKEMESTWGGVVTHVRTATDTDSAEITIGRATPGAKGAVRVRTQADSKAAAISFMRPLRKLNLDVPKTRMFVVEPVKRQASDGSTVYVFPMASRVSVPRKRQEGASTEASGPGGAD